MCDGYWERYLIMDTMMAYGLYTRYHDLEDLEEELDQGLVWTLELGLMLPLGR
jgi:hypothetical protein